MCKHVPVEPCQSLIGLCVAEEEVLEPTAESLKGEYALVLPKKIFNGFVFVRYPHSFKVEISRSLNSTVDGVIDLIRSRCVWGKIRNDSGQTSFNCWNERADTRCFIPAIEAKISLPR